MINMEQLDFENFISSSSNWFNPFDGDGAYLTASRQILETITEETSEDEDNFGCGNWSQYEHEHSIWSSESETGSVIRMEVHNDQDSISERDLACPAKRPRHDDFIIGGIITTVPATASTTKSVAATTATTVVPPQRNSVDDLNIRKYQRSDEFFDSGNSFSTSSSNSIFRTKPIRDDFFSDSDSLSYNSLSRSSSLIQFESLERQLLLNEQNASSVGNSSPSLLSFEAISTSGNDRGSSGCLKRYESIDTRLHQTYYDLDKISFDEDNLLFSTRQRASRSCSKSDSESSDNSILSHEERILRNPVSLPPRSSSLSIPKGGGRNSAENLSEDSGYCDGNGIVVKKSKSLQNFEFVDDEKYKQNSNCNIKIDPMITNEEETTKYDINKLPRSTSDGDDDCMDATASLKSYLSVSLPEISVRDNRGARIQDQDNNNKTKSTEASFYSLPIDLESNLPVPFSRRLIVDFYNNRDIDSDSDVDSSSGSSLNDITVVQKMSRRYSSSDEPSELGKGNFLLDEISDHFNKNLSILNDRENSLDTEEKYKKIINKFIEKESQEEDEEEGEVQHVKLTIRKPPRKERKSTIEVQTISQHLSKTFDQDPTNLTTSYATSLEKCNFDAKELSSQTDLNKILPKRRFRTTQKKRGLVSSTPNLNENVNDIDDDELCISSAHASCAQLAPIGILVQAGSKQSVGKEVSFFPVVSKYSWAEQSSEECNDASTSTLNEGPQKQDSKDSEEEEDYIHDDKTAFNTQFNEDVMENTMNILPSVKIETNPQIQSTPNDEKKADHHNYTGSVNMFSAIGSDSRVSIASGSTEERKRPISEFLENDRICSDNVDVIRNKSNSSENLNPRKKLIYSSASTAVNLNPNNNKMSSSMTVKTSVVGGDGVLNNNNNGIHQQQMTGNNNYLMNSKFKVNEKSPNKGFFSRFANGFRFSLRRKKKDKSQKSADNSITSSSSTSSTSTMKSSKSGSMNNNNNNLNSPPSPDFIYIPLKGQQKLKNSASSGPASQKTVNNGNHVVVTGKPPLPTPPRIVGVSEKVRAGPHAPDDTMMGTSPQMFINNNNKYSSILTTSSPAQTPAENTSNFLEHERGYYEFRNQLTNKMNGANANNDNNKYRKSASPGYSTNFQNKIGLIETNLDTHETKISGKTRSLMELGLEQQIYQKRQLKIHEDEVQENGGNNGNTSGSKRPHKSMEFLLDKENQRNVLPPENELRKTHENSAVLSEHQLRVQASLQRLNIPDWFKQYNPTTPKENGGYKPGNFSRKRTQESARWTGLNSKTTSLSSLGSQKSERNLILLSPSAHSHHGQTAHSSNVSTQQINGTGQAFGRWSTSHLNSNQVSPSTSGRSTFTRGVPANSSFISVGSSIRNSYRTPYLGWRSQEKLAQPRTPHERLASTLLANKPAKLAEQPEYQIDQPLPSINHPAGSPEIQSSIKEVTSAIVHYVNDQNNRAPRSRSVSPNSRCWLESSFVGLKPVDSPQTPVIETSTSTFSNLNSGNNTNISSNNTTITSKSNTSNNTSGMNGGLDGESSFII